MRVKVIKENAVGDPTARESSNEIDKQSNMDLLVMSERVRVLTDATMTAGRYEIFEMTTQRDGGVTLHRHDWDEEFYILEGTLRILVHNSLVICNAGDSLRVSAGESHAWRSGSEGARFLSITSPGGVSGLFRALHQAGPDASREDIERLNRMHGVKTVLPTHHRAEQK